ncbi:DUF6686 family protein [uncultured Microscilla sp.]|uniref:DUF6686 family protein n=1 Tax=uncultured Microscilla sp. TaxID=432653 RepID=UPI0026397493|nr:DUF6686 family protein [uncultured Microscilla sp.]
MKQNIPNHFIEVYQTPNGAVYQSNKDRCFWVEFNGAMTSYKVLCFYKFKKAVDNIDLDLMANNSDAVYDYEIIAPCSCERCYVLTLTEIAELKELLSGAKVMLELNSILYERLYSVLV